MNLYDDISSLKGIGEKMKALLNECGIFNIMDLVLYFPRDYEQISFTDSLDGSSKEDSKVIIKCIPIRIDRDLRTKTRKTITTIVFKYGNGIIKGKWFNQPYIKDKFNLNEEYILCGKITTFNNETVITNPVILKQTIEIVSKDTKEENFKVRISPKYPLKAGITNNFLVKVINNVLMQITIMDNLPKWILEKYKLCSLDKAIRLVHGPTNVEDLTEARKRLKYQELFTYSLKVLMLKDYVSRNSGGIAYKICPELKLLKEKLPFSLTEAQSKVMREILMDQKRSKQMNRLVQGDVGSGKTIVAIISMFNIVKNGFQAALMAPTEILANQHFIEVNKVLEGFDVKVGLLCGSTTQKQKDLIRKDLKEGNIDILVGTHALIEDNVEFKNLGMVVTDEQHRFGVMQRSSLFNKGNNVDILVMTATPIPRTLALYLYGDLEVSIIDELPPGRQKIETYYLDKNKKDKAYNFAIKEISAGRQVYIVCPLVEENEDLNLNSVEKLYNELSTKYFKNVTVEMLHGKMPNKTKDEIMNRFKNNEVQVLISTTVIEVGINVPNATLMIIENAERFGLAQLHQLRGRVGRGIHKSYCILIADIKNEIVEKRMEIIKNNSSGFIIAEEDLKLRGSGELFGFRQSGENSFVFSDLIEDIEIFKMASQDAKKLLKSNEAEDIRVKAEIVNKLKDSTRLICFN